MHCEAPNSVEKLPAKQLTQAVARMAVENVPSAQLVHSDVVLVVKVPAAQFTHTEAPNPVE
jgi:hypothetical protein